MPAVNFKVQKVGEQIALDVLALKKDETLEMTFKDQTITIKRIA